MLILLSIHTYSPKLNTFLVWEERFSPWIFLSCLPLTSLCASKWIQALLPVPFRLAPSDTSTSVKNPPGPNLSPCPTAICKGSFVLCTPRASVNHLQRADVHHHPYSHFILCWALRSDCIYCQVPQCLLSEKPLVRGGGDQTRRTDTGKTAVPAPRWDRGSVSQTKPSHFNWNSNLNFDFAFKN